MQKHNKGSTLLLLIFIIAIFMIYGTTLFSFTIGSTKLKAVNNDSFKAVYYAEAGLDEAIILTNEIIYDHVQQAREDVDAIGIRNPYIRNILFRYLFYRYNDDVLVETLENTHDYRIYQHNHLRVDVLNYNHNFRHYTFTLHATYGTAHKKTFACDVTIFLPDYDRNEKIIFIDNKTLM